MRKVIGASFFVMVHMVTFHLADAKAVAYRATLLRQPDGFSDIDARDGFGGVYVGRGGGIATNGAHALAWFDAANDVVDLHPDGFESSFAVGVSNNSQVGWGNIMGWQSHAILWRGSSQSAVDLHPSDYLSSVAYGVSDLNQVGWGFKTSPTYGDHALLWKGTAQSAVELHPPNRDQSRAYALNGESQVGYTIAGHMTAALWHGSADSFIDLNPNGFYNSIAMGIDGNYQVGSGSPAAARYETHALLWQGSAASVVDLHPAGFRFSHAEDVYGITQVGFGNTAFDSSMDRALLWQSTAASVVDLHQYLDNLGPSFKGSRAFSIDVNGDVIGHAIDLSGQHYAVRWSLIPEPQTAFQAGICAFALLCSRVLRPNDK